MFDSMKSVQDNAIAEKASTRVTLPKGEDGLTKGMKLAGRLPELSEEGRIALAKSQTDEIKVNIKLPDGRAGDGKTTMTEVLTGDGAARMLFQHKVKTNDVDLDDVTAARVNALLAKMKEAREKTAVPPGDRGKVIDDALAGNGSGKVAKTK